MKKKFAENDYAELFAENNLLYIELKPECLINYTAAEEIFQLITHLCEEGNFLVCQDMNNLKWIDKQARTLWAKHPENKNIIAWAYHSKQPIHKVMYTIFKTLSKPEIETAFFRNSEEGKKWLQEMGDDYEKKST